MEEKVLSTLAEDLIESFLINRSDLTYDQNGFQENHCAEVVGCNPKTLDQSTGNEVTATIQFGVATTICLGLLYVAHTFRGKKLSRSVNPGGTVFNAPELDQDSTSTGSRNSFIRRFPDSQTAATQAGDSTTHFLQFSNDIQDDPVVGNFLAMSRTGGSSFYQTADSLSGDTMALEGSRSVDVNAPDEVCDECALRLEHDSLEKHRVALAGNGTSGTICVPDSFWDFNLSKAALEISDIISQLFQRSPCHSRTNGRFSKVDLTLAVLFGCAENQYSSVEPAAFASALRNGPSATANRVELKLQYDAQLEKFRIAERKSSKTTQEGFTVSYENDGLRISELEEISENGNFKTVHKFPKPPMSLDWCRKVFKVIGSTSFHAVHLKDGYGKKQFYDFLSKSMRFSEKKTRRISKGKSQLPSNPAMPDKTKKEANKIFLQHLA